ncbi:uncharacterized protein LOC143021497 [Oratosquilla oratoria]|uniref:uncharacterized protein LOC143021497 n=1 Tax=Oratosquilla oratoria TaxID=337810 RepID=UPI003F763B53
MSPEPVRGSGGNDINEHSTVPGGFTGPHLSSSEDENDIIDINNAPNGYIPLPQHLDQEESEEENGMDYSSLSSIMAAYNTHGPNVIETTEDEANGNQNETSETATSEMLTENTSSTIHGLVHQDQVQHDEEQDREQATIWNTPQASSSALSLDNGKVEEIKSLMANFTLPASSIPPWAREMSEDDWKHHLNTKINNNRLKKDDSTER